MVTIYLQVLGHSGMVKYTALGRKKVLTSVLMKDGLLETLDSVWDIKMMLLLCVIPMVKIYGN